MAPSSVSVVDGPALVIDPALVGSISSMVHVPQLDKEHRLRSTEHDAANIYADEFKAVGLARTVAFVQSSLQSSSAVKLEMLAAELTKRTSVAVPVSHSKVHATEVMQNVLPIADVHGDAAFYVADLGTVRRRLLEFVEELPNVTPHYAVKCNPDPIVVHLLASLGASFDCASSEEISLVASTGITDLEGRIVYANPCKQPSQLKHAAEMGISLMTFDSEDELVKIHELHPRARLLLRIAVEDTHALCPLSSKYGASMSNVPALLRTSRRLGLNIVGVAFHVGSGCTDVSSYTAALTRARDVFDQAVRQGMPPLTILDVGGGFPGRDGEAPITFREIATTLRRDLDLMFDKSVRVIAEPGRYFVTAAFHLATKVLSCRTTESGTNVVVIGDGVHGSFRDAVVFNVPFLPNGYISASKDRAPDPNVLVPTTLCGPTYSARDVLVRNVRFGIVAPGDWLYFLNMGAYTRSLATRFGGLPQPRVHYYLSAP